MAAKTYAHDGQVRDIKRVYVHDGAQRDIQKIFVHDGSGVKQVYQKFVASLTGSISNVFSQSVTDNRDYAWTRTNIKSDGSIYSDWGWNRYSSGWAYGTQAQPAWGSPLMPGAGASYSVMLTGTLTSEKGMAVLGGVGGFPLNTWLSIGSEPAWSLDAYGSAFTGGEQWKTFNGTLYLSGPAGIINSVPFYLHAAEVGSIYSEVGSFSSSLGFSGASYSYGDDYNATLNLSSFPDGTWALDNATGSGNWWTPTVAAIGNSKYIRYTVDAVLISQGGGSYAANSGWLLLNSTRGPWVSATAPSYGVHRRQVRYLVEYGNDGANAILSAYVTLQATAINSEIL